MEGHESNGNKCKLYLSELCFVISRISLIVSFGLIAIGYHLGRGGRWSANLGDWERAYEHESLSRELILLTFIEVNQSALWANLCDRDNYVKNPLFCEKEIKLKNVTVAMRFAL